MCWLELQEGKDAMRAKPYSRLLGVTAACVKRSVVQAGKFFKTSPPPTDAADVDTEQGASQMSGSEEEDVGLENSPSSEMNTQHDRVEEEEPYWLQQDIGMAVAALNRLATSGSEGATTVPPSATQEQPTAPNIPGGATEAPVTDTAETVSCCVFVFVVLF